MKLLLSLFGLLALASFPANRAREDSGPVFAQERESGPPAIALDSTSREALLERWNRLPPADQKRLHERFERFRSLSAEDRESLSRRSKRIQKRATAFYELFSSEERERLDRLSPEKRREILLALATEEEEERALRLRLTLPPDLAESAGDPRPERRRQLLEELRRRQEEHLGPAIERFGLQLGLEPQIIERLKLLPLEQRKLKFLELAKALSTEHLASRELPAGLTAHRWERMSALEPEEFFAALLRLRSHHPDLDCLPRRGPPRHRHTEDGQAVLEVMMRLRALARPSEAEWLELAPLEQAERKVEIARRSRERVLAYLRSEDLLSAERLAELEQASSEDFSRMLRELVRPPRSKDERGSPGLEEMRERCNRRSEHRRQAAPAPVETEADDQP